MAKVLPVVINAPGSAGLNTEQQYQLLGPEWLTKAENAILTYDGRVGARKGWVSLTENEPITPETTFELTVGALDGGAVGYWDQVGGSVTPSPVEVEGVTIDRIVSFNGNQLAIHLVGGATSLPEEIVSISVETAEETLVLDAVPDSTTGGYMRWDISPLWAGDDVAEVYTISFLGAEEPAAAINVTQIHEYIR